MVTTRLRPEEAVQVDRTCLDQLYEELGTVHADDVVSHAMEEIAVRMARVQVLYRQANFPEMSQMAQSLVAISGQIGLISFSHVARDVARLGGKDDPAALGACVARLIRSGENSLLAIWSLQGAAPY